MLPGSTSRIASIGGALSHTSWWSTTRIGLEARDQLRDGARALDLEAVVAVSSRGSETRQACQCQAEHHRVVMNWFRFDACDPRRGREAPRMPGPIRHCRQPSCVMPAAQARGSGGDSWCPWIRRRAPALRPSRASAAARGRASRARPAGEEVSMPDRGSARVRAEALGGHRDDRQVHALPAQPASRLVPSSAALATIRSGRRTGRQAPKTSCRRRPRRRLAELAQHATATF